MAGYVEPTAAPEGGGSPFPGWTSLSVFDLRDGYLTYIGVDAMRRGWISARTPDGRLQWERIPSPGETP